MSPWITYRTRFLVNAKQLTASLTFTDVFGRPHTGRKGDYLVESNEGVLRIHPRKIFEDIYVPLPPEERDASEQYGVPLLYESLAHDDSGPEELCQNDLCDELCQNIPSPDEPSRRRKPPLSLPAPLARKSPQPYRDRRLPSPRVRSL